MNTTGSHETKHRTRANPATHMSITIILVVCAMTATAFLAKFELVPWTTLIFVAGTVGGVVNNFRRLQKLPETKAPASSAMTDQLVTLQIYVSPFVGGVFAIVLYGIFMSGFVQGSFFPAFAAVEKPFTTFREFAASAMPATNADMAKAIVWAFIAGFSEGLVPNMITKIAEDAGAKGDSNA